MTRFGLFFLCVLASGCGESTVEPRESNPPVAATNSFDPNSAGSIQGTVRWDGELPVVEPFHVLPSSLGLEALKERKRANPNAPRINSANRGVEGAIVFLRGIDPARSRPWNPVPVSVEMKDFRFVIWQGDVGVPVGLVRRGDAITMVSRQAAPHGVHADGAAFFTLPFLDPEMPLARRLEKTGVVELSSSMPYFWMRAYLFVDEHPYYTATAADGSFMLTDVPAGDYQLVCWMPNWHETGRDLDPESGCVIRLRYRPPVEAVQQVHVGAGAVRSVNFRLTEEPFAK